MLFLRHGESAFNAVFDRDGSDPGKPDAPLTSRGHQQAAAVGARLAGKGITTIFSSPYTRALQTATAIGGVIGAPVRVEPLVGERRLYSCDIGTPASILKRDWPQVDFSLLTEENWWLPAKESHEDLLRRIEAFRAKWRGEEDENSVLAVSHWYFIYGMTGCDLGNTEMVAVDVWG